jgi:hypothetical protein
LEDSSADAHFFLERMPAHRRNTEFLTPKELAEEQGIKPGDWKIAAERAKGIWPEE